MLYPNLINLSKEEKEMGPLLAWNGTASGRLPKFRYSVGERIQFITHK